MRTIAGKFLAMNMPIKSALISVYHKDGLAPIVQKLHDLKIALYSTGGTFDFIQKLNIPVTAVEDITQFPEILDGRVKTLHPAVFGGILARRANAQDLAQLAKHNIGTIDLVIVDLYPFEETVKNTANEAEIIEKIDIGGISLIRATAKNFNDTLIISNRNQYADFLQLLEQNNGNTTIEERRKYATAAFLQSAHYDTAIFNYFNQTESIQAFQQSQLQAKTLRYGENPHQEGVFYGNLSDSFDFLNGKELSYNNLVDVEASIQLIKEFSDPTFIIIKHTNSCGIATRSTIKEAYLSALACDPVSAFGGVLISNQKIDVAAAAEINNLFFEVITAPDFEEEALAILMQKKNRIILKQKNSSYSNKQFKSLLTGVLEQTTDYKTETAADFKIVTERQPTTTETADLLFAIKTVKHLKSNGIAIVKNQQLIGMGCGQTSRVDALESALKHAKAFGFDVHGAVMASEAFFPFPDCVQIGSAAGIIAIAQPGGSIKDADSIQAANVANVSMVMTGIRHFKH